MAIEMDQFRAERLLDKRLSPEIVLQVLESLDASRIDILRVEGFRKLDNDQLQACLELIIDFSHLQQFSTYEQIEIAKMFISNRAKDDLLFEIIADVV